MATFNKTHAPTSRKYGAAHGILIANLLEANQYFQPHSSVFALKKIAWKSKFSYFFASKKPLCG